MGINDLNTLNLLGGERKGTKKAVTNRKNNAKLFASLDAHPLHAYSPTGHRNMQRRFGLTNAELESALLNYERLGELSEAERRAADLAHALSVIEGVITPPKRKTGPKGKSKKGGVSL